MVQLTIRLTGQPDGSVHVAGQLADQGAEHQVGAEAVQAIQQKAGALTRGFGNDPQAMAQVGNELREVFLRPIFDPALDAIRCDEGRLLVTSDQPECLRLPWEFLPGPDGNFLITAGRWNILRSSRQSLPPPTAGLSTPPLRLLFSSCAPTDLTSFDYEQEEDAFVRIAHQLDGKVHIDIVETGTFEETCNRVAELKPQILYLSGHSALKGRMGHFAFENERGLSDLRPMPVIADGLLSGKGVRLLVVTGHPSWHAGAASLCDLLTATNHVPVAMAWPASVADEYAANFIRNFLRELAQGRTVESALSITRRELSCPSGPPGNGAPVTPSASFTWQQVYAASDEVSLVDPLRTRDAPVRSGVRYELFDDNICGLKEGFVGRRRLLQRTRPALRDGGKHVLLLTGISGSGRSTLALRLASLCQQDGFQIASIQSRRIDASQFCLRLLGKLATACEQLGHQDEVRMLRDGQRPIADRLRLAVETLNKAKIILVLDNLEEMLTPPPSTPVWNDPDFAVFFRELTGRLKGQGRVILTCSQVPEGFDPGQENLAHESLPAFTLGDFFKYLRRHDEVARRLERGELRHDLVAAFHGKLGITPRFVKQASALLSRIAPATVSDLLNTVADGLSAVEQQALFRDLFLPKLFNVLPPELRLGLSRVALVENPLPLDGVVRISGLEKSQTEKATSIWFDLGLILQYSGSGATLLYTVHPLQREFFTHPERLPSDSAKAAHLAAATFFQDCFEVNREDELRVSVEVELLACFQHATAAGDPDRRRWAAVRLSRRLQGRAEFRFAMELIEPLLRESGG